MSEIFGINDLNKEMQGLIRSLDVMDDNISKEVADAVRQGGDIIAEEMRRLAPRGEKKLAPGKERLSDSIESNRIVTTKAGNVNVKVGYDFKRHPGALHGIFQEFGYRTRPAGKSKRSPFLDEKLEFVPAQKHIRQGFANKVEEAVGTVIEALGTVVDKWGSAK